jgi:hypothetical protein
MTEQEQAELWRLRTKWLGVYHVAFADGVWHAKRYQDVTILSAHTPGELDGQMQADHTRRRG